MVKLTDKKPISVTIPTFNRLDMLKVTLPQLLSCDLVAEIIIVDDGGTDGTYEYLQKLSEEDERITCVRFNKNQGMTKARNKAIGKSTGDYVLLTDDDFFLQPGYLETMMDHMISTHADLIGGRSIWPHIGEKLEAATRRANRNNKGLLNYRTLEPNSLANTGGDVDCYLSAHPLLVNRSVIESIQFFEGYTGNSWREDSDFELSAIEAGYKFVYCPHVLAFNLPRKNQGVGRNWLIRNSKLISFIYINNKLFLSRHKELIKQKFPSALIANNITLTSLAYAFRKSIWLAKTEALKFYKGRFYESFRWEASESE